MRSLVHIGCTCAALILTGLPGCRRGGTDDQVFTRQVPAPPAAIVGSAVATFANHGISVAVADEPGGKVRTAPVNLREGLATGSPDDRIACPAVAGDTSGTPRDNARVTVTFEVRAKAVRDGSVVTLEAKREDTRSGCVVKSTFVAQLLDQITQGARRS
jgi:hypothetical protein